MLRAWVHLALRIWIHGGQGSFWSKCNPRSLAACHSRIWKFCRGRRCRKATGCLGLKIRKSYLNWWKSKAVRDVIYGWVFIEGACGLSRGYWTEWKYWNCLKRDAISLKLFLGDTILDCMGAKIVFCIRTSSVFLLRIFWWETRHLFFPEATWSKNVLEGKSEQVCGGLEEISSYSIPFSVGIWILENKLE